jgi:hypothetical protein
MVVRLRLKKGIKKGVSHSMVRFSPLRNGLASFLYLLPEDFPLFLVVNFTPPINSKGVSHRSLHS